jgi:hypothetical protein
MKRQHRSPIYWFCGFFLTDRTRSGFSGLSGPFRAVWGPPSFPRKSLKTFDFSGESSTFSVEGCETRGRFNSPGSTASPKRVADLFHIGGVGTEPFVELAQWKILGVKGTAQRHTIAKTGQKISELEIDVVVQRRYRYYIWRVFLPLLAMVAILLPHPMEITSGVRRAARLVETVGTMGARRSREYFGE